MGENKVKGLYTEEITESKIPFEIMVSNILGKRNISSFKVEQFCDDGEGDINRYNVYKIYINEDIFVLKKSDDAEIYVYKKLLKEKSFPVPEYFGNIEWAGKKWIIIEFIKGIDLRDFTKEMACACADSVTIILNQYWQNSEEDFEKNKVDNRFERYWKRINKRVKCLEKEPELKAAYQIFLKRQLICPRTLCNGDFLQFNAIYQEGKVYLIDWAFAGIMPYSLDIARLIAHGTKDKRTFPFYMNDECKEAYIQEVYDKLTCKPDKEQYLFDIKLSLLNEYIEFIEGALNDTSLERGQVFKYYYGEALKIAKKINCH